MQVTKAKREQIKVPILLMGASGSGKTLGALLIAKGMIERMHPKLGEDKQWDKIGVIDTEHKRTNLYVDTEHDGIRIGEFPKVDLQAPFTSNRYLDAFQSLISYGCEVVIVDGISNAWSDEGGVLQQVDNYAGGTGGMQGWKSVSGEQRSFLHLLTNEDVHVIATARSKQGVEVTKDDNGKLHVEKIGLKIEQKDSLEYEFAIAFQIYENHIAQATKDNSSIFNQPTELSRDVGNKIVDWAEKGIDVKAEENERVQKAVKQINDMVKDSEGGQMELKRQIMAANNIPIDNWSLNRLKVLYVGIKKIVGLENQTNLTTEKEGK